MTSGITHTKAESRQFSFRDMLAMVFRRKWVILSIFLGTLAMGVSASLKSTSEFQATAKVLIRRSEGSSFQRQKSPYLGLEEEMNTEIEILRSNPVMNRAESLQAYNTISATSCALQSRFNGTPSADSLSPVSSSSPRS